MFSSRWCLCARTGSNCYRETWIIHLICLSLVQGTRVARNDARSASQQPGRLRSAPAGQHGETPRIPQNRNLEETVQQSTFVYHRPHPTHTPLTHCHHHHYTQTEEANYRPKHFPARMHTPAHSQTCARAHTHTHTRTSAQIYTQIHRHACVHNCA